MNLEEVDVGCLEACEGGVDGAEDCCARETEGVDVVAVVADFGAGDGWDIRVLDGEETFGENEDFLARDFELDLKSGRLNMAI